MSYAVCVFCGARAGAAPQYAQQAETLGRGIAQAGWRLVYGAGDVGLMGVTARAAQAGGAQTLGVIPKHLEEIEISKRDLTQYIVTENMHERKKVMFINSDCAVILPGGVGTLEEFFEVLTWAQLSLHAKPIVLINVAGYWDALLHLIDHVIAQGFADASVRDFITVVGDAPAALSALEQRMAQIQVSSGEK